MNPLQRLVLGSVMITLTGMMQVTQPASNAVIGQCGVRLTLTSGTAITTSDVTAATSVFVTPWNGAQCAFYDGTNWIALSGISEVTVSVPASTSTMYDVFCLNTAGAMTCDSAVAWTNDTTRATALTTQNGVYVKSGTTTRRYIGSFRTTTVSGQTEDSALKRYVWNYYNRVDRPVQMFETSAASWNYTTATIRQANAAAANQVDVITGVAEEPLELTVATMVINSTTAAAQIGIGVDSTSTFSSTNLAGYQRVATGSASNNVQIQAWYRAVPTVGRHVYSWNEYSEAAGTTTWNLRTSAGSAPFSGITGKVKG